MIGAAPVDAGIPPGHSVTKASQELAEGLVKMERVQKCMNKKKERSQRR